jgi:hypothetical protein
MKKLFLPTLLLSFFLFFTGSCFYDTEEELYPELPGQGNCDLSSVSFQTVVWPIMQGNCVGCHGGANPSGNVFIRNYQDVQSLASSGKLSGVLKGLSGNTPMPPSGPLDDCSINQIDAWIALGSPND